MQDYLYYYGFYVTRVIDGDSIEGYMDMGMKQYQFKKVRLADIDCAENRSSNPAQKAKGVETTNLVAAMIDQMPEHRLGRKVIIKTHYDESGKYGRPLVTVFLGDIELNGYLLENGHAVPYGEDQSVLWETTQ